MDAPTARQNALDARKEAKDQPTSQALSDMHAYHVARSEAALKEAAERCEANGDLAMAMRFMGLYNRQKGIHADATALALEAGIDVGVRSGER